jgi:4-hydroxybenzoate polyprenyltransferase
MLAVALIAQIFAIIAGLVHVMAFVLESLVFHRPGVQRFLLGRTEVTPAVRLWAFNQGFYNLFLATGAIVGAILWIAGSETGADARDLHDRLHDAVRRGPVRVRPHTLARNARTGHAAADSAAGCAGRLNRTVQELRSCFRG